MRMITSILLIVLLIGCAEAEVVDVQQDKAAQEESVEGASFDGVVKVDEETYTQAELDISTLVQKIKIELGREQDRTNLSEEEFADKDAFWDDRLAYYENVNVQLNSMIDIIAMSKLAEENNYYIPEEKLREQVEAWNEEVSKNEAAQALIQEYGENEYKRHIREYTRKSMLRDRVVQDLEEEIREENPEISPRELNYTLSQRYEELYMDHLEDLEIQIQVAS